MAALARNIVLIVLDSVRADHLSCYGYPRQTTPFIDALARRSILWESAYSVCSWTKPSVASLLSGLYPSKHGVLKGPKRTRGRAGISTDVLPPSVPHVAERFSSSGVRCAAFLNNVQLERYTNFDRGFDVYDPVCGKADHQLERFSHWLEADHKPFFAYLHFMETHWPYKPRRRHVQEFGGSRDESRFNGVSALELAQLRRNLNRGLASLGDSELEDFVRLYDASIRRLDGKVKEIARIIDQKKVTDDTALVITADHGEEFLEHGSIGHGRSLYTEVTHVPLLICPPANDLGERRSEPLSLVDLPKTLLNLAGIDSPFPGHDLLENGPKSAAYCQLSVGRSFHRALVFQQWRLHRRAWDEKAESDAMRFACRVCGGEFTSSEKVELFDISRDANEKYDLSKQPGMEEVIEAATALMNEQGNTNNDKVCSAEVDEVVIARLRDLGYVE